jgi:hypothetical protein
MVRNVVQPATISVLTVVPFSLSLKKLSSIDPPESYTAFILAEHHAFG